MLVNQWVGGMSQQEEEGEKGGKVQLFLNEELIFSCGDSYA